MILKPSDAGIASKLGSVEPYIKPTAINFGVQVNCDFKLDKHISINIQLYPSSDHLVILRVIEVFICM